jgi:hypothetical protein
MRAKPERQYFVCTMSNHTRLLYIGVTNNIAPRVREHKNKMLPGFTGKYNLGRLVHVEATTAFWQPSYGRKNSRAGFGGRRWLSYTQRTQNGRTQARNGKYVHVLVADGHSTRAC